MNILKKVFLLISLFASLNSICQLKNESPLTLDQIMNGDEFVGHLPERISWSDDSKSIYFNWNPESDTISSRYKVDISTKAIKKLGSEELIAQTSNGNFTRDQLWKVYGKNGDIFLMNTKNYSIQQITNTLAYESSPLFSGDEKYIVFQSDSNLFKWNIKDGGTTQITNFNKGKKPKKKNRLSEQDEWLKDQQIQNFQVLVDRENRQNASKYRRELTKVKRPLSIYLDSQQLRSLKISPNLNYVVYNLYSSANNKNTAVPNFVTESGYTTNISTRPKVGSKPSTSETWIYNVQKDTTYQVKTDKIEGILDKPNYMKDYVVKDSVFNPNFKNPRNVTIGTPIFSEANKAIVNITSRDNKDRWIMNLDLSTGNLKLVNRQHDDAWIGGPEVGWFSQGKIQWIDNDRIWFKSEKTGYAHIYIANIVTGEITPLTSGNYEVIKTTLSKDKKSFYIVSNKVSPFEQHFYHLSIKTGKMTQITQLKGGHEVTISPDEKQLAIRYSNSTSPWELYVMPNKVNGKLIQLTQSTTKTFKDYAWKQPEIIRFKSRDGADVPATLLKPTAAKNNGAAVIFVHGAGYLQNVHNWWSSYFREYMFHNMLVDNGYTVLAIDFRASSGYGRDWRTGIYRHMGGKDLDDQIDGATYLIENHGVTKDKIGIYGGSYGGFITLMAMFKYPDTFKSGAALRSVADWSNYNHGYTSPILNTPVEDSIAYNRSSPIKFAEGLKGNLLILHGMVDTNVHFQDVVQLSQRLIELKKENWEMAVFPVESHGFIEASSWRDEYYRIFKLFQETLID